MHVFIEAGLRFKIPGADSLSILEIGLGTGLNAFLAFLESGKQGVQIRYTAIEKHFLPPEIYASLDYAVFLNEIESTSILEQIHRTSSFSIRDEGMEFHFRKIMADARQPGVFPPNQDIVFYDAFAPSSQAEMWESEILERIFSALEPGGILVTYCAKGQFRRDLEKVGFTTERIPGPPRKREMIRATRPVDQP